MPRAIYGHLQSITISFCSPSLCRMQLVPTILKHEHMSSDSHMHIFGLLTQAHRMTDWSEHSIL